MHIDITHQDIGPELCRRCAACCRVRLHLPNTDSRYRCYLRTLGYVLDHPVKPGQVDCCDKRHDVRLDMGDCPHLERVEEEGEFLYRCRLYGTSEYPDLCTDFDCVSWARCRGQYNDRNTTLVKAQQALDELRNSKG